MALLSHFVLLISSLFIAGNAYTISTEVQVVSLEEGESIELNCVVESTQGKKFNNLKHTVEWRKKQDEKDATGVLVATFANLNDPFPSTNRYVANAVIDSTDLATFKLTISNLQDVDSGWYRCQVVESSEITESVEHKLSVISPVDHLILRGFQSTANMTDADQWTMPGPDEPAIDDTQPDQLDFSEATVGYAECIAVGGYPYPTVRILIGDTQINGQFETKRKMMLVGDTPGLQKIVFVTRTYDDTFHTSADHDHERLTCKSEVVYDSKVYFEKKVHTQLNVQGKPMFYNCSEEVKFPLGSTGATITCNFFAKPQHTSVMWHGVTTNAEISGSAVNDNTESLRAFTRVVSGDYLYQAVLQFPTLVLSDFQLYELTVRNAIGSQEKTIRLSQGTGSGSNEVRDVADPSSSSCFLVISALSILLTMLFMQ